MTLHPQEFLRYVPYKVVDNTTSEYLNISDGCLSCMSGFSSYKTGYKAALKAIAHVSALF